MKNDGPLLFKSISFLTSLVKSSNGPVYVERGFTLQEFEEEVVEALEKGLSTTEIETYDYKQLIKLDISSVINFLLAEGLIFHKNKRYYITEEAENISDFMLKLSSTFTMMNKTTPLKMDFPFRNYPNSNQFYGLN